MILSDTSRYLLPVRGATGPILHLATILDGVREYLCFFFVGKVYVEEVTGGSLSYIEDDQLHQAIIDHLHLHGVLDARKPLLPDEWMKYNPRDKHALRPNLQVIC